MGASRPEFRALETLEPRVMLDGNVTAVLKGSTLKIAGDRVFNNAITLTQGAGSYTITGRDATTVNGLATDTIFGAPTKIAIQAGAGLNDIMIDTLNLAGTLQIKVGRGADFVTLAGVDVTTLKIDTNFDNDILLLNNVTADVAKISGASGVNTLQTMGVVTFLLDQTTGFSALGAGESIWPQITADQFFTVPENSANTTAVGTVARTYTGTSTLTWSITAGNELGGFAIDAATGAITVANGAVLNYEGTNSFALTVNVTDTHGLSDSEVVNVYLSNVNEAPVVNNQTFSIAENSPNITLVGSVDATDVDIPDTLTYAITGGNALGVFAINATNGQITILDNTNLNFEVTPSFALTVTVTDAGLLSDTATMTVNLTNVNEAPVVNDQTFSVAENSPNTTVVGTVAATDVDVPDTLTYAITGGNALGIFGINAANGQITVVNNTNLNYEVNTSDTLTVSVMDLGTLTDTATITINFTDVNEAPVLPASGPFNVDEDAIVGAAVGTINLATDVDVPAQTITYSITAGNTGDAFTIDANTGAITVFNALDHETIAQYTLTIQATDNGVPVLNGTTTVVVDVNDINEAPVLPASGPFSIAEDQGIGIAVGTINLAVDPDAGDVVAYSIIAGNTGGAFAIDGATGAITVAAALDYETITAYTLTIQAVDDDAVPLSDTVDVVINVTNVLDPA